MSKSKEIFTSQREKELNKYVVAQKLDDVPQHLKENIKKIIPANESKAK